MKRLFPVLLIIISVAIARSESSILFGSLTTVDTTTNNSAPLSLGTVTIPRAPFLIQNAGLASTNALRVDVQVAIGSTNSANFITVATFVPTTTNATTVSFSPIYTNTTVYLRLRVGTTNSVGVGGIYQN